ELRYNIQGQTSGIIDALGNSWEFAYDEFGFPTTVSDPLGNSTTLTFNLSGVLEMVVDRNGRQINFEYDEGHRLITETWDTTPPTVIAYAHNAAGQLISATAPDSALTIRYTNTGLIESIDNTGTPGAPPVEISYAYDANQNIIQVTDSLNGMTSYEYNALDRVASVSQSGDSVNDKRIDVIYDDAGLLRELRRFADLGRTQPVTNTSFDYDCRGCPMRLGAIQHRKSTDNSEIHDLQFIRNPTRDIDQTVDAEGIHLYTYDQLRRLRTAEHPVQPDEFYTYDVVGNRLSSHLSTNYTYSYMLGEGGNQLRSDDHFNYEYDNSGSLIRKTDRSTAAQIQYSYDHRNRLVGIVELAPSGDPVAHFAYQYDAANRRIRADENGEVTHFIYDAHNPILRLDGSGNVETRRLYTRVIDGVLADEVQGQTRWFLTDQIGSVRDLVDNDSESINHYTYDSFGTIVAELDSALENELNFASREFNRELGIGYYRARSYSPEIGRFLQEDPLSPFNYVYVNNNPLIFTDPTGEVAALEYGIALYCKAVSLAGQLGKLRDAATGKGAEGKAVGRIWRAGAGAIIGGLEGRPVDPRDVIREVLLGLTELEVALFNTALGDAPFGLKVGSDGSLGVTLKNPVCAVRDILK
ncbi:MAG: hypothetical protein O6942_01010, partial [Bacteroidetes bacterium]|nr:hypothetical protein [Bacteroidota bacterium]